MRLNVSAAKAWQHNPTRWYYEFQIKRVARFAPTPLSLGSFLHRAFDYHFKGVSMAEAVQSVTLEVQQEYSRLVRLNYPMPAQKLLDGWNELAELLPHWQDRFEVRTIASELALEAPLPNGDTGYGRLDRLVVYADKLWHWQNRSLSGSTNLHLYLGTAEMDWHENFYAFLVSACRSQLPSEVRDLPYGGTGYNIIRKLKLIGAKGKQLHEPAECFVQELVAIQPGLVERIVHTLCDIADEMRPYIAGRLMLRSCPATCARGPFGNSRCPYYGVCTGLDDIHDDNLFMDAADPYSEVADESQGSA